MLTEKKIQILLGIIAFSALLWGFQASSMFLYYVGLGCIRLVGMLGIHHHLPVEQKQTIQSYTLSLSGSLFIFILLYGFSTGQRIVTCIAIGMLVSLLWALGDTGSIRTGTYWGVSQIQNEVFIYSVALAASCWIRIVNGTSLGRTVYFLIPFVFGTLVVLGNFLKGSPTHQLRYNIIVLLSFGVAIVVSMWLCIEFVMQYIFS